ncbi:FadR/GntR family transcriptional regulator, partial [Citrobacter freundii]
MSAYTIIFAPIAQATRSEQVVERLENAIISGLLKSNEQLPNEADLARLMGVSPITVREALNTLRVKGLIDTRRGRNGGSFVC